MIVNNVSLSAVAVVKSQYPDDNIPEIAFVGKSNVGKSSLINTMINRKTLARISGTPGKTRTINFYNVDDLVYFVDLPGYGYAKAPQKEIDKWAAMIDLYLLERKQLKNILFLIDIRHSPSKNDITMYEWLRFYNYKVNIVLTKSDKLTRNQLNKNLSMFRKTFSLTEDDNLVPFSSLNKSGRDELWDVINKEIQNNNI